ncbi:hypothetical protein [Planobispora longispora]|uniref:Uncharacterized protein n=1 Tax=Planobispora longispora TaxID=28887 RepID=A0A8J3W5W8_9ACTN|nr:hypothetical protein [Planobispora longispora]GIH76261.1 hypothetical protein Plo01_26900 [Planobispora longispora]
MSETTSPRRLWTAVLRRWPTALAVGLEILTFGGGATDQGVLSLSEVLLLLPLLYLVVAKLRRREASWPVLLICVALLIALRVLDVIAPAAVFGGVAMVVLVWGAVDGQLYRSGQFRVQALGMLGFGAVALAGLIVDPELGRYLVAAGWFFHGVWDFVHLKLDKVVSRSYAEWCGVLDILIAVQLVFML